MIRTLSPILALVSPSGMSASDREEWLVAAADALKGIPLDLLSLAAQRVKAACDHPAKVVPFILADVQTAWRRRKDTVTTANYLADLAERPAKPKEEPWRPKPGETAAILAEFGIGSAYSTPSAPKPIPTVEDYMSLGLTREEAEKTLARQMADLARDKTVGKAIAA